MKIPKAKTGMPWFEVLGLKCVA